MRENKSSFGLSVMSDEEASIFAEVAMNNNSGDPTNSIQDLRMVDAMLSMQRQYVLCGKASKYTRSGNPRKNAMLLDNIERILEGRLNGAFSY